MLTCHELCQDMGLAATFGPTPNALRHHLSVTALYNGALAAMCLPEAKIADSQQLAEAAWSEAREGGQTAGVCVCLCVCV